MKAVVTLTTIPSRLVSIYHEDIKVCLDSLLNQDFEDYEIHFNIPYFFKLTEEEYIIPEWLNELVGNNPKLKIFRGEDYGSITKLVDTIKRIEDSNCIIITADDDLVYHPEMVSEQYKNQTERFSNCAVGYDGISALEPVFRDIRSHYVVSVPCNVKVNVLQHYKTVSYKRSYFEEDFFTDFVGQSWADDILVSAYMGKQKITKYVTYFEKESIPATIEEWNSRGGVTTFPIIKHTQHDSQEGCNIKRNNQETDNFMYFVHKGYLR
jgi:glycosyltransferase involved in cell wall biosynthesis